MTDTTGIEPKLSTQYLPEKFEISFSCVYHVGLPNRPIKILYDYKRTQERLFYRRLNEKFGNWR